MNTRTAYMVVLLGLLLSSCNKWLDIQPETEISAPELFATESGFEEALLGVYTRCGRSDIYGKELTVGTLEVLAQNYSIGTNDPFDYRETSKYNYDYGKFIERKDNIWKGLYNGIVNCNLILSNIDEKEHIFNDDNYSLIKGEALGLRAYMHFDALRLFAPSYISQPLGRAIPYVTTYSKDITDMSSVSEVLEKVIADLEQAKQLLSIDPIRNAAYLVGYPTVTDTTLNTEESNPDLFLQNRRHRMNYYAVCGSLARAYLYKGDKVNALSNAQEVIASKKFPWTSQTDFLAFEEAKKDRILYKELVFGWYIPQMANEYSDNWFRSNNSGMNLQDDAGRSIYEVAGAGANDLRFKQWFSSYSVAAGRVLDVIKYKRNPDSEEDDANLHYLMAPAIRLSEMYYIAAECSYSTNPAQAVNYVDEVRTVRGIGDKLNVSSEEQFMSELLKECRKEWYAEGQVFYMYKRLNRPIPGQSAGITPASDKVFVLPLPDDEIIYGGR